MSTTVLPEYPISWKEEELDYIAKAMYLIKKEYPVPTKDVHKLAKMLEEKDKKAKENNDSSNK